MLSAAPKSRSGGASGMLGTARLLGQTTGAAVVALLFARLPQQGPTVALFLASGCALVATAVSLARLYETPVLAASRSSNPEADSGMHAQVLRDQQNKAL
jgi:DHA2 family multidrug resistance protein-like MFS transporter